MTKALAIVGAIVTAYIAWEASQCILAHRDNRRFLDTLDNPPAPNAKLIELMRR